MQSISYPSFVVLVFVVGHDPSLFSKLVLMTWLFNIRLILLMPALMALLLVKHGAFNVYAETMVTIAHQLTPPLWKVEVDAYSFENVLSRHYALSTRCFHVTS